ncbi:alpha/beta hydrolase [Chthonobacter rhizosphaerae]|uniref:alpha/beta hydrolase n=1 Tax=Chthonobacter rhizosphaerae TaxID=2735553 RepID=UPI0015EF08D3|nr:phospholipase [Chthonobacter rhizosphaerae]
MARSESHADGRLTARPGAAAVPAERRVGLFALGLQAGRDGVAYVPPAAIAAPAPVPLVLLLHGAGGDGASVLPLLREEADRRGFVILAPDSRLSSWDIVRGDLGPDVAFIDRALDRLFAAIPTDPGRLAIGGFSDGGSYALTLGLLNSDLFGDILAFSPGFTAVRRAEPKPAVFISHGVADTVLPIDRCGRFIARTLSDAGFPVDYREFDGGHVVPPAMVTAAIGGFLG